ncbi:DegV family protein [Natranaerobius thermophilus]|uniref:DegV family protein n=1 Tax=Natranaerobius thermophilus (strain ATCC BAA-1301 / DSM 18059 / JW/NM-WN-LF) TaxID=457570 RepID=B2A2L4_NATTJ|nr:DegV family protein [Natranaerobius thermophilus]ACB84929.1 degV family protein [Natranaerobius thermophilus JW/NM-WN-LF]
MTIHIVTDSTCDLPKEIIEKYSINVVPLNVHFAENTYKDKIDLFPDEFYQKLVNSQEHPETSQPSPGDFVNCYQEIAGEKDQILSIHLSSELSGTFQSANIAKEMLPDLDITVIDSKLASLAMGLLVKKAAEAREQGASMEEIVDKIDVLKEKITLYFFVDTLEYLKRGGRIGKAQALVGSLLDIKPILTINNEGIIEPIDKVRTKKKAINKVIDLLKEAKGDVNVTAGILYSGNEQENLDMIKTKISEEFNCEDMVISPFGPVIGVHVGPGAFGVCMI